jgi:hypothetical protein
MGQATSLDSVNGSTCKETTRAQWKWIKWREQPTDYPSVELEQIGSSPAIYGVFATAVCFDRLDRAVQCI